MTAQINDEFTHRDAGYSVAGISAGQLFDPATLDLKPSMASTACWRGYQVIYGVVGRHLVVADLHVNLLAEGRRQEGPLINGISPVELDEEFEFFNNHYEGINYHLEYSGGLLLANGFIEDLYMHMGFQLPWKYERVIELVFTDGMLVDEFDRSERMAETRERILAAENGNSVEPPSDNELRRFVESAFDRSYRL